MSTQITPENLRPTFPIGQETRRGNLREGDRVQIKDPKGRLHTITLVAGGYFQTNRGGINHDDLIGHPDGQVITTPEGRQFQVLRPLRHDYVMGMPRGAAIIYPKDAGTIIHYADIFPGARVFEAGAGSGALSLALLDAVGTHGHLISVERREDFADIARANVDLWFGRPHPAWDLRIADAADELCAMNEGSIDRIIFDMLAPWENLDAAAHALIPGGVLLCYVATVTQMSRLVEDIRSYGGFTDPEAWETMARGWHLDGLAVRPDHRMVAHTGFLVTTRRLAPGVRSQERHTRPSPGADGKEGMWDDQENWSDEAVGARISSPKKIRKVRRDLSAKTQAWVEGKDDE
ncbi:MULTISPECIES: tRNA (adenine-N1)-methyltransferase [unclassified Schaalia]|uniref:tRNA (adenine-N1)-methyltransferase n=1 Tax=unclassified Schaalia TaxID=2691889 RepID=UPI001E2A9F8F|nr:MULTISPECIES: tRNA (adenine-N1)-methyltransferase [unclassified Schaalia]MCD4549568.1 tRNA (adenine-N1)-methyltransferase [Schaalia sp. lx-260]MCD4558161.1 tRNA (adenine-N1)-methyltransferase [Schaalia sp. lx-100]